MGKNTVRIGGASGFWGDTMVAGSQLVRLGNVEYLVLDYLAELTMSILARQYAADATKGYATDFVDVFLKDNLRDCIGKGIKIVANAGGVNPQACADAAEALAKALGVEAKIAIVSGDSVLELAGSLRAAGQRDMFSNADMPETLASANAYFGAMPIAAALAAGADIVVTGRCVDSALVLGILVKEFGWGANDYDLLAAGSLAGHVVECGAQATGGLFTDWHLVEDWAHIGFPVIECAEDGTFTMEKPPGTGGLVTPPVVAEQILYEIGDPQMYFLPDVTADFAGVTVKQTGPDKVLVSGARGRPPTDSYKVSATYLDGWRAIAVLSIIGEDAAAKAERTAAAIFERTRELFGFLQLGDYRETVVDALGAESSYGAQARTRACREIVLRIGARHSEKRALQIFLREISPAATGMAPATTGSFGNRSKVQPVLRLFSFLLPKDRLEPRVLVGRTEVPVAPSANGGFDPASVTRPPTPPDPGLPDDGVAVPLRAIAHGRSGDKGDNCNIGIIARHEDFLPFICAQLTTQAVGEWFSHWVEGEVERFDVPGLGAVNFLLHRALGGGGMASLRNDPLGKSFSQILLDRPVRLPRALADRHHLVAG